MASGTSRRRRAGRRTRAEAPPPRRAHPPPSGPGPPLSASPNAAVTARRSAAPVAVARDATRFPARHAPARSSRERHVATAAEMASASETERASVPVPGVPVARFFANGANVYRAASTKGMDMDAALRHASMANVSTHHPTSSPRRVARSSPPATRPACAAASRPCECAKPPVGRSGSTSCHTAQSVTASSASVSSASTSSTARRVFASPPPRPPRISSSSSGFRVSGSRSLQLRRPVPLAL